MGSMIARDLADGVAEGTTDLDAALTYHLTANHYPPVPVQMVPYARFAIEITNLGRPGTIVDLPPGVLWNGKPAAPASAFIESFHLHHFLADDDE